MNVRQDSGRLIAIIRTVKIWVVSALEVPRELADTGHHRSVESEILSVLRPDISYPLLVFCACGIATLGLLQSSVAVVIGAMLISPLMGPIMAMGLALAKLEYRDFNRAALTLVAGAVISILASMLIVWASPLKDSTPEILARTRPDLLDLIIAALSGVVGAYVTLTRRGGVIAGVAIATALMPPLAVVGFGIVTGSPAIAGGALLLFVTNVVAILAAVLIVSRWLKFGSVKHRHGAGETVLISVILIALCAPLALSLTHIVAETRLTNQVRSDLVTLFRGQDARIDDLQVEVDANHVRSVQTVVITQHFMPNATVRLRKIYGGAAINLEQVVAQNEKNAAPKPSPTEGAVVQSTSPTLSSTNRFINQVLSRVADIDSYSEQDNTVAVNATLKTAGTIDNYQNLEKAVSLLFPDNPIHIIPPEMALLPVAFSPGHADLPRDDPAVNADLWALVRWQIANVEVTGFASTPRDQRVADRIATVAKRLTDAGIVHVTSAISTVPKGTTDYTPGTVIIVALPAAAPASSSAPTS